MHISTLRHWVDRELHSMVHHRTHQSLTSATPEPQRSQWKLGMFRRHPRLIAAPPTMIRSHCHPMALSSVPQHQPMTSKHVIAIHSYGRDTQSRNLTVWHGFLYKILLVQVSRTEYSTALFHTRNLHALILTLFHTSMLWCCRVKPSDLEENGKAPTIPNRELKYMETRDLSVLRVVVVTAVAVVLHCAS